MSDTRPHHTESPTVSIVFLAFNRRDELGESMRQMLYRSDFDRAAVEVIVVDNASDDGSSAMVQDEFPDVQLIRREENCGVSGWNDGFALATGDYVLALDDDCYLPADGLRTAVEEAARRDADLVSFGVVSSQNEDHRFDVDEYLTGLLAFWGCAVLFRREVLDDLRGFDPHIFVYAHEVEFMLRFFDRGFRHLYLPEVVAVHMKAPHTWHGGPIDERPYRANYRNWGYVAGKLMRRRDALEALVALIAQTFRDGRRKDPMAFKAASDIARGFVRGLRVRAPVRAEVSHLYRQSFESFSSPWWFSRTPREALRDLVTPGGTSHANRGRREAWFAERARFYPDRATVLDL